MADSSPITTKARSFAMKRFIASLLASTKSSRPGRPFTTATPPTQRRCRVQVEELEPRQLLSTTAGILAPAAPSFTAAAVSATQINLAWKSVGGATSYLVDEWVNGAWKQMASLGGGNTSCSVTSLSPHTTYYFELAAVNTAGTTWAGTYQSATTFAAAPPAAPALKATAFSASQVNLFWNSAAGANSYRVDEWVNGAWKQVASLGTGSSSYAVTGLSAGTTYYFTVAAANTAGTTWATYQSATTASIQTASINQQIIAFCQTHLHAKVGGGECAQLVSEALRVAGANFMTSDPNHNGDYVWGTLVTTMTPGQASSSARCQPGDIIQFQNVTLSGGWTASHHTAIVAAVDSLGRPTQVYEQNVGSDRTDRLDVLAINPNTILAGTIHIYRAVVRSDSAGKVQFSVVNDTTRPQTVTVYFNGVKQGTLGLDSFNTQNSYQAAWYSNSGSGAWSIGIGGTTVALTNAGGYELFTAANGQVSIRTI
jgi:hypothetical protein